MRFRIHIGTANIVPARVTTPTRVSALPRADIARVSPLVIALIASSWRRAASTASGPVRLPSLQLDGVEVVSHALNLDAPRVMRIAAAAEQGGALELAHCAHSRVV